MEACRRITGCVERGFSPHTGILFGGASLYLLGICLQGLLLDVEFGRATWHFVLDGTVTRSALFIVYA